MRVKLTKRNIDTRCLPPAPGELNREGNARRQKVYMDDELKGFGLVVGRGSKTFFAQGSINGESIRMTVGRLGEKDLSDPKGEKTWIPDHARDRAMLYLAQMRNDIDPREVKRHAKVEVEEAHREEEWRRVTLREAIAEHVANMATEDCAERSMRQIPEELDRHCPDWLDVPLVDISRPEAIDRHRAIVAKSGRWVAHRVMAQLRACWNSARERFGELPEHPFRIKRRKKLRRRREPIP